MSDPPIDQNIGDPTHEWAQWAERIKPSGELLTKEQVDRMVKDARFVGPTHPYAPNLFNDLCCHVKALACDHEKLRAVADAIVAWIAEESPSVAEQQAYDRIIVALERAGYSL